MRRFFFPERKDLLLTDVLHALSDVTRLQIVRRLDEEGELPCGESSTPTPKSTLSHHLKVLRESGLIATRAEGTQLFNSLRRADLDTRFPGLLDVVLEGARNSPPSGPSLEHAAK